MDKFNYEANGYNRSEVNQFVQDVIHQTEGIMKSYRDQKVQIERLEAELKTYKAMEETLNRSIINAEKIGENIRRMARDESDIIIGEARQSANRIVNDALIRAEKIELQMETLKSNMKIFKRKLRLIMEQQMAVVEEIEILELD